MSRHEQLHVRDLYIGDNNENVSKSPFSATFTIGAEASNAIPVAIQLKDAHGKNCASRYAVQAFLSSDANGDVLEAASAGLSVTGGTDGLVSEINTDNTFILQSESDGDIDVTITETTGANVFYLVLIMPMTGKRVISGAITFA